MIFPWTKPKPTRRRPAASASRRRRPASRGPRERPDPREWVEGLEQRHYDVIGLALVASAIYLAFVLYLGWDGGRVGGWLADGLEQGFGRVAYVVPIALFGWGVSLIARPWIAAPSALNAGGVLVLAALLLAFAAQTAGLGPERPHRHDYFEQSFMVEHGGAIGESLYWASTTLFQRLGAHILVLLMFVSGALLLTGTTLGALFGATGRAVKRAGTGTREVARTMRTQRHGTAEPWGDVGDAEIAITRSRETETFETERLVPDGDDEAETIAIRAQDDDGWDADEDDDQFTYEADGRPGTPGGEAEDVAGVVHVIEEKGLGVTPQGNRRTREGITESDEIDYKLPPAKALDRGKADPGPDMRDRDATSSALLESLRHFGVEARLLGVVSGPHVSRYELQLAPGTKVSKVAQLRDDLAYALASTDIRILAPIPGKKAVGVEVPNQRRRLVRLGDIYAERPKSASPLLAWLGKDVSGQAVSADLALMPHVLVAGTTGSGKSGCINAILTSILMHASPNEVRMVLVDPKRVELNHYERIPHLLTPVVTNPRLAANVLANLIGEMESRYAVMSEARARNLVELNRVRKRRGEHPLPHILCVIDELADLMMVAPADVEDSIIRLAQKARAIGIHLVLATQRPSTDVITGTIKVNIPSRIAFAVASQVDSRVILDGGGAETLLGQGDMLFRPVGTSKMNRIQGAFVTEDEIARVCNFWSKQGEPEFAEELLEAKEPEVEEGAEGEFSPDQDDLLADAARIVVESETASVSMIQRRLRVGYTRAGRLIDMLERRGIISGYEGSKPRQVLVSQAELPRLLERLATGIVEDADEAARPGTETDLEPV
ncbi:MAG: segregation ATPase FtsK/SpoIIIE, family [Solirubrobacterales bacterium]|jgi:S-DNA-T family DNA segregation ATPase FtsK/SpoIIIE|nr:segregation ATPase FtsK/SpoIIIE, family [Solirubrobacterales bacterium]